MSSICNPHTLRVACLGITATASLAPATYASARFNPRRYPTAHTLRDNDKNCNSCQKPLSECYPSTAALPWDNAIGRRAVSVPSSKAASAVVTAFCSAQICLGDMLRGKPRCRRGPRWLSATRRSAGSGRSRWQSTAASGRPPEEAAECPRPRHS
jgi:hypothetical protein